MIQILSHMRKKGQSKNAQLAIFVKIRENISRNMENHEHDLKNWSIVEKETRTSSATICATRQRQFVRCVNTASNPDATQSDRIAAKTPAAEQQELFVRNDRGRLEPDGKTRFAERGQWLFCTVPARCNTCESLAGRGNHRGDHLGDL